MNSITEIKEQQDTIVKLSQSLRKTVNALRVWHALHPEPMQKSQDIRPELTILSDLSHKVRKCAHDIVPAICKTADHLVSLGHRVANEISAKSDPKAVTRCIDRLQQTDKRIAETYRKLSQTN